MARSMSTVAAPSEQRAGAPEQGANEPGREEGSFQGNVTSQGRGDTQSLPSHCFLARQLCNIHTRPPPP